MNNWQAVTLKIWLMFLLCTPAYAQEQQWLESLDEALRQARTLAKPVFVDFWAEWCHYCVELEAEFAKPFFSQVLTSFVLARVNFDIERSLAIRYGIRTLPTTLILDARGQVLMKSVGRTKARVLLRRLKHARKGYETYLYELDLEEDPSALRRRADYLLMSGNPDRAHNLFLSLIQRTPEGNCEDLEDLEFSLGLVHVAKREFENARQVFQRLAETSSSEQIRSNSVEALKTISQYENRPPAPSYGPRSH